MPKVTYNNKNAVFYKSLKIAVEGYFQKNNIKKTGNWALYNKAIVLISAAVVLYVSILFAKLPAGLSLGLCAVFGAVLACIGFNVMHDACHGSYSTKKWVNELLGLTLNALGGNAFFWKQKHNIIHHTYTNVDGLDDDIAKSPFIRMCSTQKWMPAHKVQHIYLPFLYMLGSIFWIFAKDFTNYFQKTIYTTPINNLTRKEHWIFWISKGLYFVFYIIIPIAIFGFLPWLVGFLVMHFTMGFTLSIVFQLAHVVEETEFDFVAVDALDAKQIESEWAVHQIKTTANFAPHNKIISWFVGGLNFQIEHHLFPRVSHVHYPAISKIVAEKCREFNLNYISIPTMLAAISSHFKLIRDLGKKPGSLANLSLAS
jgi:linoleoyl-CoA desaturase